MWDNAALRGLHTVECSYLVVFSDVRDGDQMYWQTELARKLLSVCSASKLEHQIISSKQRDKKVRRVLNTESDRIATRAPVFARRAYRQPPMLQQCARNLDANDDPHTTQSRGKEWMRLKKGSIAAGWNGGAALGRLLNADLWLWRSYPSATGPLEGRFICRRNRTSNFLNFLNFCFAIE